MWSSRQATPLPCPPRGGTSRLGVASEEDGAGKADTLRRRLLVSLALAIPVVVLAMIPALQFRDWQWASLALASPVVLWGAWPFHRAAIVNARHGAATMDTLISVGVAAAYLWSLSALLFGEAGRAGMRMSFAWLARGNGAGAIYLEVASGVTALILLGRYFEAAPGGARARRCGRCCRWAPGTSWCCATAPRYGSRWSSWQWARSSWSGRGRRSPPTGSSPPAARPWTPRCSPASRSRPRWARVMR